MIDAFEGNRAESKTIIPLVQRFVAAHGISGVTAIADAGMMSEVNLAEIEDAGWSFVIGGKLPEVPYAIKQWRQANPDLEPADGMVLTQPVIMGPKADQRRRRTLYQYKSDRARRGVHGIEQQVAKAEKAVAGQAAIKRNRFVTCPAAPAPSTVSWRPRPRRWPAGSRTSPTSSTPTRPG